MRRTMALGASLSLAASLMVVALAAPSLAVGDTAIYSSIPATLPGNVPSLGYEATSTSEFGDLVEFAPSPRHLTTVEVVMSSWGCESGHWTGSPDPCETTPGATFSHDVTLNLYEVDPGPSAGALIAMKTTTFDIPFRPSADAVNCDGLKWYDATDGECYSGYATTLAWDFSADGVYLPSQAIWTVTYNTTHYGASPVGTGAACYGEDGGCGYDSLNVGAETFLGSPFAGSDVDPDGAFLDSDWSGAYCDGGTGGTGSLREDTAAGCWTDFRPLAEFEADYAHVEGTWATDVVQEPVYETVVRPPINSNGSSNFPKKRGAIPIQFDLLSGKGDFVFESICEDGCDFSTDESNDYSYLSFTPDPSTPLKFGDIGLLVADYEYLEGDCGGGALRWSIALDTNGDGSRDGSAWMYYGQPTTDCTAANSQSGLNLVGEDSVGRWDTSQLGGSTWTDYDAAVALLADEDVLSVSLVLDTGWYPSDDGSGDDRIRIDGATVNDATFTPEPSEDVSPTCDLPDAKIAWEKTDPVPSGIVNDELINVQRADDDGFYRKVDCKYMYNLDVSSLGELADRAGTYKVYVEIDGELITTSPARFDLR